MYKDMLLKLEYYKAKVLKAFIKQGKFPQQNEIAAKVSDIDSRLALFKSYSLQPGDLFNTKEINHCLEMLYNDLIFLYKILEDIQILKFNTLLLNVEINMNYLEDLAINFKKRGDEEVKSTSLGNTVFFKSDSWHFEIQNETMEVDLGTLSFVQGTEILCFANVNNANKKNVLFKFECDEDPSKSFTAFPYNYNNDTYIIPGEVTVNEKDFIIQDSFNINSEIVLPSKVNMNNEYKILAGNKKIIVTDKITNKITLYDFPTSEKPFVAPSNCYISFYTENKGTLEYNFSHKPFHCNFSLQNGLVQINKDIQKIFLDVDEGFTCYFEADNINIWSTCEEGIKDNNKLIYGGILLARDLKVKEYVKENVVSYNVTLKITEVDNDEIIDCVYIKEVS